MAAMDLKAGMVKKGVTASCIGGGKGGEIEVRKKRKRKEKEEPKFQC